MFPVLSGEKEETVNEGTFGKSLSLYLQDKLCERGYRIPFTCPEDWGWWVEIKGDSFTYGVCIYSDQIESENIEYACLVGIQATRTWSWRKFKLIVTKPWADKLFDDLMEIFKLDSEVTVLGVTEGCPVGEELED